MLTRRAFIRGMFWVPPVLVVGVGCTSSSSSLSVSLDHSWPVALGQTMTFRLTATCRHDLPDPRQPGITGRVAFSLQDGLTAVPPLDPQWVAARVGDNTVSGTAYRRPAAFKAFIPQTFELQVRLDQPGDLQILASAAEVVAPQANRGDTTSLFLRVTPEGTQIQRTPFSPTG